MNRYIIKPITIILCVYLIPALGIASDVAQLTDFNLLSVIKSYFPFSIYSIIIVTILLYIIIVFGFNRKEKDRDSHTSGGNSNQSITTRDVSNSTIIQINKSREE